MAGIAMHEMSFDTAGITVQLTRLLPRPIINCEHDMEACMLPSITK